MDNEKNYHLMARLPGVPASSVDVKLSEGFLNLQAREPDTDNSVFHRKWQFPNDADPSTLRAWCTDGVLEVKVDKFEPLPPVQIMLEKTKPIDLTHDENAHVISRLVPGISADDIHVEISDGSILTIKIEAKPGSSYTHTFTQNYVLPKRSDGSMTRAWCENGILTLHIPKAPIPAPIEIAVNPKASMAEPTSEFKTLAVRRIPGYSNQDVKLTVQNAQCLIELQRDGATVAKERFALPERLEDPHALDAVCENGVLTIQYPKSALAQYQEVDVHVSDKKPDHEFFPKELPDVEQNSEDHGNENMHISTAR